MLNKLNLKYQTSFKKKCFDSMFCCFLVATFSLSYNNKEKITKFAVISLTKSSSCKKFQTWNTIFIFRGSPVSNAPTHINFILCVLFCKGASKHTRIKNLLEAKLIFMSSFFIIIFNLIIISITFILESFLYSIKSINSI